VISREKARQIILRGAPEPRYEAEMLSLARTELYGCLSGYERFTRLRRSDLPDHACAGAEVTFGTCQAPADSAGPATMALFKEINASLLAHAAGSIRLLGTDSPHYGCSHVVTLLGHYVRCACGTSIVAPAIRVEITWPGADHPLSREYDAEED
jgi:hypothetical protein